MATYDDVARLATALPEVTEGRRYRDWRSWQVGTQKGKGVFAWERPFTKADVARFGDDPVPDGPILAVATDGLEEKTAVLAAHGTTCLTIPHLDGYPAVLVRLDRLGGADDAELRELLVDAWFAQAPAALAERHRDLLE